MATDENAQRFMRISDIAKEPQKMLMPIRGFEKMPLVSLEEAVEPLVSILPEVQDYVYIAKQRCDPVPADGLTKDQSASIMLYSMEWAPHGECLYFVLNETLRAEDRQKLKPWFSYLKLILTALARIPSKRHFVYRGVKMDLSKQYPPGKTFVWWGFSSCTSNIGVLENEQFLGKKGERTMFSIDCESGKDISRHSYYQSEEEILLVAARQFVVKACFEPTLDLHMIQLIETESPVSLIKLDINISESLVDVKQKEQSEATLAAVLPSQQPETVTAAVPPRQQPEAKNEVVARSGAYSKLYCNGRSCGKCRKCRDWYYTGDLKNWQWIGTAKKWGDNDWTRWRTGRIEDRFKQCDDATCDTKHFHFDHFYYDACLCEDNTNRRS